MALAGRHSGSDRDLVSHPITLNWCTIMLTHGEATEHEHEGRGTRIGVLYCMSVGVYYIGASGRKGWVWDGGMTNCTDILEGSALVML